MKNKNGFTLIELLVVIALIGLIMLLVAPKVINVFNDSKKNAFYDEVVSLYNNAYTTYATRLSEGDTSKRYCLGEDETLNKLEIKDKNNFYYDIQLNNEGKVIKIKVKNKNYNISISNSNGLDKSDIKVESIQNNDKSQYLNCSGEGLTLTQTLLRDNPIVSERTDFSVTNSENTTGTIYKTNKTEDGNDVYYYSGNTISNWIKFGKYNATRVYGNDGTSYIYESFKSIEECNASETYNTNCRYAWKNGEDIWWRIIRSNEDGSLRLLYVGNSHNTENGFIGSSYYTPYHSGISGYMYKANDTFKDSNIKQVVDKWYEDYLLNYYDKYISKTAIYCNDRSVGKKDASTEDIEYGTYTRLYTNKTPSYKCGDDGKGGMFESTEMVTDKFSASTSGGGNGLLKYPIALMTTDEIAFAGGVENISFSGSYAWFYTKSDGKPYGGNNLPWWLITPINNNDGYISFGIVYGSNYNGIGKLSEDISGMVEYNVRPVISLSSCAKIIGSGTINDPYVVDETNSTC